MGKQHSQSTYKHKKVQDRQTGGTKFLQGEHPCHPALLPSHVVKMCQGKAIRLSLKGVESRQFMKLWIYEKWGLSFNWMGNTDFLLPLLLFLRWGRTLYQTMSLVSRKISTVRNVSAEDQRGCLLGFCKSAIWQQLDWNCDKYLCHLAKWRSSMPCNLSLWLNNWQKIKICLFKSLKASQLWAQIHTLLGKQGSFLLFLFIVLTIWISLKKK